MKSFSTLTDDDLAKAIHGAQDRIVMAAPGVSEQVAGGLAARSADISVRVIIDPDPDVCRLGYGVGEGIVAMSRSEVDLRRAPGLRIGALIIDDAAWIFAPAPLIAVEPATEGTTNAVAARPSQVEALLQSLVPECSRQPDDSAGNGQPVTYESPDIGHEELTKSEVQTVADNLEARPPKSFDLIRQTLVYSAEVQFVELRLLGTQIEKKTVPVPAGLLEISKDKEFRGRLKSTFRVIDGDSGLSSKGLVRKRLEIEKTFVRKLGSRFGNVILLKEKEEFVREIEKLKKNLEEFKQFTEQALGDEIEESKRVLAKTLIPMVARDPPRYLLGQIGAEKADLEKVGSYVRSELDYAFPNVKSIVDEMKIDCIFKDVTFETLTDPEFLGAVRDAFPSEFAEGDPYRQSTVAPEREHKSEKVDA